MLRQEPAPLTTTHPLPRSDPGHLKTHENVLQSPSGAGACPFGCPLFYIGVAVLLHQPSLCFPGLLRPPLHCPRLP